MLKTWNHKVITRTVTLVHHMGSLDDKPDRHCDPYPQPASHPSLESELVIPALHPSVHVEWMTGQYYRDYFWLKDLKEGACCCQCFTLAGFLSANGISADMEQDKDRGIYLLKPACKNRPLPLLLLAYILKAVKWATTYIDVCLYFECSKIGHYPCCYWLIFWRQ